MRFYIGGALGVLLLPLAAGAQSANPKPAGLTTGPTVADAKAAAAIMTFRKGFQISVDGTSWSQSQTVDLSPSQCTPATTSPCAAGAAPVRVHVRFPALPNAVPGSILLPQIGLSTSGSDPYHVFPVPMNARSVAGPCSGGFSTSILFDVRLVNDVTRPGTPLPLVCRWAVLAGLPRPGSASGVDLIWSDTITLKVIAKP